MRYIYLSIVSDEATSCSFDALTRVCCAQDKNKQAAINEARKKADTGILDRHNKRRRAYYMISKYA